MKVLMKELMKFTRILNDNTITGHLQPAFTCSKLTIETLEQGVKYVQSLQQRHQNDAIGIACMSLLLTLNIFHTLFLLLTLNM